MLNYDNYMLLFVIISISLNRSIWSG